MNHSHNGATYHGKTFPPQKYIYRRIIQLLVLIPALLAFGGCTTLPPKNIDNICDIFKEKRGWYKSSKRAFKRHGIPIHVQMAIIHQESRFQAKAKPKHTRLLGVVPWFRPSSAYGYAQVKDETWDWYIEKRGIRFASRKNFADAVDFISWYGNISFDRLQISKWNAYQHYLAYHEGQGGFERKTYLKKPWLIKVAKKVKTRASRYHTQLSHCEKRLNRFW